MAYCQPCNRNFRTYDDYQTHLQNSAMHVNYDYEYQSSAARIIVDCPLTEYYVPAPSSINEYLFHDDGLPSSSNSGKTRYSTSYENTPPPLDNSKSNNIEKHQHSDASHAYCPPCDRTFQNGNNLKQHLHSRAHVGVEVQCSLCGEKFATGAGLTIHLESGRCPSGMNRQMINNRMQEFDQHQTFTKPSTKKHSYQNDRSGLNELPSNRSLYECHLCPREFSQLQDLENHLASPVHERNLYSCPRDGCGVKFKTLSGLIQHQESETCGYTRFEEIQHDAKNRTGMFRGMAGR